MKPILDVSSFARGTTLFDRQTGFRKGRDWNDPADFGAVRRHNIEKPACI